MAHLGVLADGFSSLKSSGIILRLNKSTSTYWRKTSDKSSSSCVTFLLVVIQKIYRFSMFTTANTTIEPNDSDFLQLPFVTFLHFNILGD